MTDIAERVRALHAEGVEPRLHPQGFVQLSLTPDGSERLHVWDHDVPRVADRHTIHDHVWDFTSFVLRGTVLNDVFGFQVYGVYGSGPRPDSAPTSEEADWVLWQASDERHEGGRGGKHLQPTATRASVHLRKVQRVEAPRDYFLRAGTFHDSRHVGLTATLFRKGKVYGGQPRIFCKQDRSPDAPLPADYTQDDMWRKIYEAVR